jgi:hypothetical protein
MENSFVYSKSISFLTGWTRSTQPDPYHKPAPPTLSLCTTARWAPRAIAAHRSASTSLCGWVRTSGEKNPQSPHARALFRPPATSADSAPHAAPRTFGWVTSGCLTPPSLPDYHLSSLRTAVTRWPPAPQGAATVSYATPPRCPMLIATRQPTQHGPPAACLV